MPTLCSHVSKARGYIYLQLFLNFIGKSMQVVTRDISLKKVFFVVDIILSVRSSKL